MPKSIPIPPQTSAVDGVVVRRSEVIRGATLTRVDHDIRHWAKRQVIEQQRVQEVLRRQAVFEGYRDGMAAALEDVVTHLMRTEQMCHRWRSDMLAQVRAVLLSASKHPHAMLAALNDALEALTMVTGAEGPGTATGGEQAAPMTIVLPLQLKPREDDIRARVSAVCAAPLKLEFRASDERIAVHRGSLVVEYDPDDYVSRAQTALDIDPHAAHADLHTLLAPALASLGERVDALARSVVAVPQASAMPSSESDTHERY